MKIVVAGEKIIKAVKKVDGIEIVLETPEDAKEAISLILRKSELIQGQDQVKLKDIKVSSTRHYETSAVDFKMVFLLEFLFEDDASSDTKVAVIKSLQEFFDKA
jgi:hypothetical protein